MILTVLRYRLHMVGYQLGRSTRFERFGYGAMLLCHLGFTYLIAAILFQDRPYLLASLDAIKIAGLNRIAEGRAQRPLRRGRVGCQTTGVADRGPPCQQRTTDG